MQIGIGNKRIGEPNKCFIVTEAGSNHNGELELGKRLIESARECGCDAVKFQAFKAENLVTKKADKAEYQKGRSSGTSQFEMLKTLEFSIEEHFALVEHAGRVGIPIFYSVFDKDSADLVEQLSIPVFKLGSGELTNIPLIKYIAEKRKPLIISTGMGTDEEIADAVTVFREEGNKQLVLMNCCIAYPSRLEDANLRRAAYLERKFDVMCGNSDHTEGIFVSVAAAALGIPVVEKHLTLDKDLPGPDHSMSLDPAEMKRLCSNIRVVEKEPVAEEGMREALKKVDIEINQEEIEKILGREDRKLSEAETNQRIWSRKSVVAARNIERGEVLTDENLAIKRPEKGILPGEYAKVLGRTAGCAIEEGTPVKWDMLA